MDKQIEDRKIPTFNSIQEAADFWDTHDITDFENEFVEEVDEIFKKTENNSVYEIKLPPSDVDAVQKIAHRQGIHENILISRWIHDKIVEFS